ncbi:hypothetical protein RB601_003654 [Gaeumannomyces tritici]
MRTSFITIVGLMWAERLYALSISDVVLKTPTCAYKCLSANLNSDHCYEDLESCLCSNITLQSELSICAQKACSFLDQIAAVTVEAELCAAYPKPSRSRDVQLAIIIGSTLLCPIIILRVFVKLYAKMVSIDDIAIFISSILLGALGVINFHIANLGLGMHYWTIPIGNGDKILMGFYIGSIIYVPLQISSKLSVLFFFKQIFTTYWLKTTLNILICVLCLHGIIYILLFIIQCDPVRSIWDRSIENARCLDIIPIAYSNGALSIVEDLIILFLPFPAICHLNIGRSKRIAILCFLSVGIFACITSMVRMKYVVQYTVTLNSTWDNVDIVIWSFIEQAIAIFCASLPAIRQLVVKILPDIWNGDLKATNTIRVQTEFLNWLHHEQLVPRQLSRRSWRP